MCTINDNVVQGCLHEKLLHQIFGTRNTVFLEILPRQDFDSGIYWDELADRCGDFWGQRDFEVWWDFEEIWYSRFMVPTNQVRSLGLLTPWNGDSLKSGKNVFGAKWSVFNEGPSNVLWTGPTCNSWSTLVQTLEPSQDCPELMSACNLQSRLLSLNWVGAHVQPLLKGNYMYYFFR